MKEPILLLGPSGIGKTTVTKYAMKKVKRAKFVVLDNIVHLAAREEGLIDKKENLNALIKAFDRNREQFVEYGLKALERFVATNADRTVVVDVGTGFLDGRQSLQWVTSKRSLAIVADPAVAYDRFRKSRNIDLSYEQYMTTQFSPKRHAAYNSADVVIHSDKLNQEALSQQFLFSMLGMLDDEKERHHILSDYLKRAGHA